MTRLVGIRYIAAGLALLTAVAAIIGALAPTTGEP